MKAMRVNAPMRIEDLALKNISKPKLRTGEVRVSLQAVSLNHRELLILKGTWPQWGTFTLGSDGCGVVCEVDKDVEKVQVGDDVIIYPGLQWGLEPNFPGLTFNTLGGPSDGTFADSVVIPAENVFLRPTYLTCEESAALPVASISAFRALVKRASIAAGETLLVHGIGGGLAQAGMLIAQAIGAKVIVTSSSDSKLARAREMGAAHGINYSTTNWCTEVEGFTNGVGPDVILDCVGGETLALSVESVRVGGRIVSVGVTTGATCHFPIRALFVRHVNLYGTSLGSPWEFSDMLKFFSHHRLHPILHDVYRFGDITSAMRVLERGEQFGKIVLRVTET